MNIPAVSWVQVRKSNTGNTVGDDGHCRFISVPVVTLKKQLLCRVI